LSSVFKRLSWQAISTRLILAALAFGFITAFPGDTPAGNDLDDKVLGQARDVLFNYAAWEVDAIGGKIGQQASGLAAYMTETERSRYVHDYLQLVARLQALDSKIDALYSDPSVADPDAASADLRAQRDSMQAQVDQRQSLAESIIEGQVASVLRDEGLAILGEVLPPVSAHITELPMMLVISPRDKIRFETAVNVVNLPVNKIVDLENRIDHDLNVSSLVVPLGGLSLYPSMVVQTWYAPSVFEVVAHEWTHHYLYFFPLGLDYESDAATRTINETTASLLGDEVAAKVLKRFYGDFPDIVDQLRQYTATPEPRPTAAPSNPSTPSFDYGATMNETRVSIDSLLAQGKIEEAERYMEQQRRLFVAHGYRIRKLNQAYFAFYGGYQSPGAGAGGADPIGPAITEIRQRSPSLRAWLETMRAITSRDQLLAVRDALRRAP
jgi:hypothetical protein